MPFFKYPPNPPAVGDPDTITKRTITYLLTLVIGLLAVWAGVAASRWVQRFGEVQWIRLAGGGVAVVVTVVVAYLILPKINEVPGDVPGDPALAVPARLARHADGAVDVARNRVRCGDRSSYAGSR